MKQILSLPKCIIFDWDGVLVDTKELIAAAYFHTFLSLGKPLPEMDMLHQLPGTSLRDYFPKIFGEDAKKAERFFYAYVNENHLKALKTTEGSEELLGYLKKRDIPCSIVSNKRGDILRKELEFLDWTGFFHKTIGSKDCPEDKPSPKTITAAVEGLNAPMDHNTWFVGDWMTDLECAHRSHLFAILFNNPVLKDKKDLPYRFDFYINDCKELKKILTQL
ncbi:MAG: HAD hydrolase-like protein [Alphaproteobacteria bacterium]